MKNQNLMIGFALLLNGCVVHPPTVEVPVIEVPRVERPVVRVEPPVRVITPAPRYPQPRYERRDYHEDYDHHHEHHGHGHKHRH